MESSFKLSDVFEQNNGTSYATICLQGTKVVAEMQDIELTVLYPVLLGSDVYAVFNSLGVEEKNATEI